MSTKPGAIHLADSTNAFPVLNGFKEAGVFLSGQLVCRMLNDLAYIDAASQNKLSDLIMQMVESPQDEPQLLGRPNKRYKPVVAHTMQGLRSSIENVVMPSRRDENQQKLGFSLPRMIEKLPCLRDPAVKQRSAAFIANQIELITSSQRRSELKRDLDMYYRLPTFVMNKVHFSPDTSTIGNALTLNLDQSEVYVTPDMPKDYFMTMWRECILPAIKTADCDPYPANFGKYQWCGTQSVNYKGESYTVFFEGNNQSICDLSITWNKDRPNSGSSGPLTSSHIPIELFRMRELRT